MTWKQLVSIVGMGVALVLLGMFDADASTRAIKGVQTTATMVSDTIMYVCYALAAPLIAWTIYEARQHGMMGAVWQLGGAIAVVAIALLSDEIITMIRPGAALAFAPGFNLQALAPMALWELGSQVGTVALVALGIRRVRRARRV